jgi:hypothetical protein
LDRDYNDVGRRLLPHRSRRRRCRSQAPVHQSTPLSSRSILLQVGTAFPRTLSCDPPPPSSDPRSSNWSSRIGGSLGLLSAGVAPEFIIKLSSWSSLCVLIYWRRLEKIPSSCNPVDADSLSTIDD